MAGASGAIRVTTGTSRCAGILRGTGVPYSSGRPPHPPRAADRIPARDARGASQSLARVPRDGTGGAAAAAARRVPLPTGAGAGGITTTEDNGRGSGRGSVRPFGRAAVPLLLPGAAAATRGSTTDGTVTAGPAPGADRPSRARATTCRDNRERAAAADLARAESPGVAARSTMMTTGQADGATTRGILPRTTTT